MLTHPKGPRTKFKVFGSPGTPGLGDKWAFGYERGVEDPNYVSRKEQEARVMTDGGGEAEGNDEIKTAEKIWSAIPPDTDILITHTPPYGHCDLGVVRGSDGETGDGKETETDTDQHLGCHSLLQRLSVVRPRLHVCGHVHRARGAERVRWSPCRDILDRGEDDSSSEMAWTVSATENWADPSPDPKSAKISLVDLTGRGRGEGSRRLDWDDDADAGEAGGRERRRGGGEGGREGRKETCVVNCAILASNYPHVGGKRFHKPVVVDLELPVCGEGGDDQEN